MDGRYIIYQGFENEASDIFNDVIKRYNFKILYLSDYGISFENSRIALSISYESGLQIWYTDKSKNEPEMLHKICSQKEEILNDLINILNCMHTDDRKVCLEQLAHFLIKNLQNELAEIA